MTAIAAATERGVGAFAGGVEDAAFFRWRPAGAALRALMHIDGVGGARAELGHGGAEPD